MQTVNVHALGPSGAGKTVYMASMYRQLSLAGSDRSFYLKTDHASSLSLNSAFNKAANPNDVWPVATGSFKEHQFTVCVRTAHADYDVVQFNYLDYPGSILTDPSAVGAEKAKETVERLRHAHALLVLLDGAGVLACLRNEPRGDRFLNFELTSTLEIVQQSRCPVHFAVTKWDLLDGQHTLREVRDRLLAEESFANVIGSCAEYSKAPIRLIPVSSVGSGFAELLPNGEMRKTGKRARPFQVELPFVSVLPDFFESAYRQLDEDQHELLIRVERLRRSERGAKLRARVLERSRELIQQVVGPAVVRRALKRHPQLAEQLPDDSEELLDSLILLVESAIRRRETQAEETLEQERLSVATLRETVDDGRSAMRLLEAEFDEIVRRFKGAHPESLLNPDGDGTILDEEASTARPGDRGAE